ncbi:hypothetical protein [Comamonas thiooxydans]|uniref:Uncharacterized protein n=1 Tax=Comamonas thiooxydans TaxID=363952 RepID=A0A0E3BQ39_9BURK|nr:hypothetical protein [Comamonas thiooxydans]KGH07166.1 hypothetical protein P608_21315 [Comamonas thiooxydans]KGH14249.1 hypothetical protein P607_23115 [Comamonas thiooxydans]KGH20178.1 hypothetical protein P606_21430 [Comamonas thiooxydans]
MTRIVAGGVEFDFQTAPSLVSPEAAYLAWANELGVSASETLQPLDGDDECTPVILARPVLGISSIASFASEGGFGLYDTAPRETGKTGVAYPGVGRMHGLGTPAKIFLTFHPDIDCRSEFVKVQRSGDATILAGRIRHYNSQTYLLNFAIRSAPGRVQLVLSPVDQPVPFRVFGAPSTPEATSVNLAVGSTTQIDISDLPFTDFGALTARIGQALVIGRSQPMNYGVVMPWSVTHLSVESGSVKDIASGLLGQGIGRVYGTVQRKTDPVNIPLKRKVRLVRERDGLVVREAWSDTVTGEYDFRYIDELQTWTVIAYDYEHEFRAVIADGITPEIIP